MKLTGLTGWFYSLNIVLTSLSACIHSMTFFLCLTIPVFMIKTNLMGYIQRIYKNLQKAILKSTEIQKEKGVS